MSNRSKNSRALQRRRRLVVLFILFAVFCVMILLQMKNKNRAITEVDEVDGSTLAECNGEEEIQTQFIFETNSDDEMDENTYEIDPQDSITEIDGATVDEVKLLSAESVAETSDITIGIDVAKYQGTIDWQQVANAGVNFAMVRVGYRSDKTREICPDSNAKYNMQEAQKNQIKVGAYFFSTATTEEEAIEEAKWVCDFVSQYKITYPIGYDCEGYNNIDSVMYNLNSDKRTDIACAFMDQVYQKGYTPIFYSSMSDLCNDESWHTDILQQKYKIWVSQYPAAPYPETPTSSYNGPHAMWQYTNHGKIPGIKTSVDIDIAYFGYEGIADAKNQEAPEQVTADVEALMNFKDVSETVTAKEVTNLRNVPSQGSDSKVIYSLNNGEQITRTGISDSGWSRLSLNGETCYAVSNYLTTDLSYVVPTKQMENVVVDNGLKTKFEAVNEVVTAKMEVNLRTLPSVTNPDSVIVGVLHNGEYATRTGVDSTYGWARVEVNGQVLYCVNSYLMTP